MTTIAPPVNGQDINVAARATRKLLDALLAEQGTYFAPFATLNTIVSRGSSVPREDLVRQLGSALEVDDATVLALLRGLESRGLVRQTASYGADKSIQVELTPDGVAEQERLSKFIAAVAAELYGGIDAQDLATTRRVLIAVTERASARLRSGT